MRYRFIEEQRADYPVTLLCRVMQVARSGYYAWRNQPLRARKVADMVLLGHMRDIFEESRETYGQQRLQQVLRQQGLRCSRKRVARLMREAGLVSKTQRRFRPTLTDSNHHQPVAPNRLNRQFNADGPNQKWVADISYVPTAAGWL